MDIRVPSGLWQDQVVFVETSCSGSLDTRIFVDPLPSGTRNLHGLGQAAKPDQKEKAIYYLSKKFTNCEINYIAIEKTCWALA